MPSSESKENHPTAGRRILRPLPRRLPKCQEIVAGDKVDSNANTPASLVGHPSNSLPNTWVIEEALRIVAAHRIVFGRADQNTNSDAHIKALAHWRAIYGIADAGLSLVDNDLNEGRGEDEEKEENDEGNEENDEGNEEDNEDLGEYEGCEIQVGEDHRQNEALQNMPSRPDDEVESDDSQDTVENDELDWSRQIEPSYDIDSDESDSSDWALDSQLMEHSKVLPPHVFPTSRTAKLRISGNRGQVLVLIRYRKLKGGNDATTLETVGVLSSLEGEERRGGAAEDDSELWVLKKYDPRKRAKISWQSGYHQIKTEQRVYSRISTISVEEKPGVQFLMWMGASLTLHGGQRGILMPLMKTDLGQWLKAVGTPPAEETRRITAQCALGIASLHSIGVIHNDIKPPNIFLDARLNVKMGDFGYSLVSERQRPLQAYVYYGKEGAGTDGYLAPEKLVANPRYSYQVDYWSLGVVFMEMVVGNSKFLRTLTINHMPTWLKNHRTVKQRREYFLNHANGLLIEEPALDILCGLLEPRTSYRMGIDTLLVHRYFKVDGVSEFTDIRTKALSKEIDQSWINNQGKKYPRIYVSKPSDNRDPWTWINASYV